ncbi:MAG: sugar transporter ATP-binding protein [Caulobacteraceae bacterium]|nr:sugar transporter ATP-binding protein [Caulobacteraceae bacterium]
MTADLVLSARGIAKSYGGVQALRGVDFDLRRGEVHGLIGANGAGKSTLCNILAGNEQASSGEVWIDGEVTAFTSVRDAAAKGVGMVHQELSLFPDLSVTENLFLGREIAGRFGLIDKLAQKQATIAALEKLRQPIDPEALVGGLSVGLRQIVEIAKALAHDARILIMDEPTSALSRAEIPLLFEVIRGLAARGVSLIYISHRLDELLTICDRLTVFRDGQVAGLAASAEVDPPWIVEKMTGRTTASASRLPPESVHGKGQAILSVRDLSLPRRQARVALEGLSLELHAGEIVGLYGLMGAGRTELLETLIGVHSDYSGEISLADADLSRLDLTDRIAAGISLVPEDRQRDGLVQSLSILHNMTLSSLDKVSRKGWLKPCLERLSAQKLVEALRIKLHSLSAGVGSLSGGNQQKVVLSRCLMSDPRVMLLDEPTRGVDVAAKAEILDQMRRLADEGVAVMFASSDLTEILSASHRIIVMSRGRIALEVRTADADESLLSQAASVDAEAPRRVVAA